MATDAQRAQAFGDMLVNKTATSQQVDRLGQAIAYSQSNLAHYNSLTQLQRADFLVAAVRTHYVNLVRGMDKQLAADAAGAGVTTEFAEG